jgi:WD40 repeat protein
VCHTTDEALPIHAVKGTVMRARGNSVGGRTIRVVLLGVLFTGCAKAPSEPERPAPQVHKEPDWEVTTLPGRVSWRKPFLEQDRLLLGMNFGPAQLWDTRTGRRVAILDEIFLKIGFTVLSRDGKRLVIGQYLREDIWDSAKEEKKPPTGTIQVWDLATGKLLKSIPVDLSGVSRRCHPTFWMAAPCFDDKVLVRTVSQDPESRGPFYTGAIVVDTQAGQVVKIEELFRTQGRLLVSPDGKLALSGLQMGVDMFFHMAGVVRWESGHPIVYPTGEVKVIDLSELKVIATIPEYEPDVAGQTLRRYTIARSWSPDSKWIAAVNADHAVRIWEADTGKCRMALFGHTDWILCVAISPDTQRVVTASEDKTARIWETATGKELFLLKGHTAGLNAATFDSQGRFVLTCSEDKTARLWDSTTGKQVRVWADHEGPVRSASFSKDGKEVQTRTAENVVRRWSLADGSLLEKRKETDEEPPQRYGALYLRHVDGKTEVWSGPPGAPGEKTNPEPGR